MDQDLDPDVDSNMDLDMDIESFRNFLIEGIKVICSKYEGLCPPQKKFRRTLERSKAHFEKAKSLVSQDPRLWGHGCVEEDRPAILYEISKRLLDLVNQERDQKRSIECQYQANIQAEQKLYDDQKHAFFKDLILFLVNLGGKSIVDDYLGNLRLYAPVYHGPEEGPDPTEQIRANGEGLPTTCQNNAHSKRSTEGNGNAPKRPRQDEESEVANDQVTHEVEWPAASSYDDYDESVSSQRVSSPNEFVDATTDESHDAVSASGQEDAVAGSNHARILELIQQQKQKENPHRIGHNLQVPIGEASTAASESQVELMNTFAEGIVRPQSPASHGTGGDGITLQNRNNYSQTNADGDIRLPKNKRQRQDRESTTDQTVHEPQAQQIPIAEGSTRNESQHSSLLDEVHSAPTRSFPEVTQGLSYSRRHMQSGS
ncbi:hypothetical protein S40288_11095 [Stachybotrys chartarum IBT 40288]|nr:hypothetical protein S40288_11095 [Stachybotrys chartarum IBT 40288]